MTPYSQLRSLPRVPLAQAVPLDKPLVLYVEVSNRCNLSCRMCPESHPDYASIAGGINTMSAQDLALVSERIEEIGGVKTAYLHCLGEPMLNPRTPAFIAMIRPNVERICLTTNGTVSMTKLLDCPPDYVRVSVYGLDQTEFERVTQTDVDHRRVLDNVKDLYLARESQQQELPYIYVKGFGKFSVLHHRYRDFCDEVDVEPLMNWNGEGKQWFNLEGKPGVGMWTPEHKRVCPAPFYMLTIHSDLRVSVCGVDWSKKLIVGDLRESSLSDIWNSEASELIRITHLDGERCELDGCRNCSYMDTTLPDNLDDLTTEQYIERINPGKEVTYAQR